MRRAKWMHWMLAAGLCCAGMARAGIIWSGNYTTGSSVYVGNTGIGAVTINGGSMLSDMFGYLGYNPGANGTGTVTGAGSTWANSGWMSIGEYGTGTLNVLDGGQVTTTSSTYLGDYASGFGTLTVNGPGSKYIGASSVNVGYYGSGVLNIEAGGQVSGTFCSAAASAGKTGTINITGPDSALTSTGGWIDIGEEGTGALNITAGGKLSGGTIYAGDSAGSSGAIFLSGTGSAITSTSSLTVGHSGAGTLTIQDGAQLTATSGIFGNSTGSSGLATVSGAGSKLLVGGTGSITVGNAGTGTLNVLSGGQVSMGSLYIGYTGAGSVTISGGSTVTSTGSLSVGNWGNGTLRIESGGQLNCAGGVIASAGGTSTATVTGAGSKLTSTGSSFEVGRWGHGTLNILAGAQVDAVKSYIGYSTGSISAANVSGSGSIMNNSQDLYVGSFGDGKLSITSGGQVTCRALSLDGTLASSILVGGAGSKLTCSSTFKMDPDSSSVLTIESGGQMTNAAATTGYNARSTTIVRGAASSWTTNGALTLGYWGTGVLKIEDGGQASSGDAILANFFTSRGEMIVRGTNSKFASSGIITVGKAGPGKVQIDGGKITAQRVVVSSISSLNFVVSGDDMLVVGTPTTAGSLANDGVVTFMADDGLAAGVYRPIAEYAGRNITWSGVGAYKAFGGQWNSVARTFTVGAATQLAAGDTDTVTAGERLVFSDAGQQVGINFSTVSAGTTFSAAPISQGDLDALSALIGSYESIAAGWSFITNHSGGEVALSFLIDPASSEGVSIWHLHDGVWSAYTPPTMNFGEDGLISFTASSFSGYAVTVPEPGVLSMLLPLVPAALRRRRR